MAIQYVATSSEYHQVGSAAFGPGDVTVSVACWFKLNSAAAGALVCVSNSIDLFAGEYLLFANSDLRVYWKVSASGVTVAFTAPSATIGLWHHAVALEEATNRRTAWVNGVSGSANTISKSPAGLNSTSIGVQYGPTPSAFLDGAVAHVAIWKSHKLTSQQISSLSSGLSPNQVRPIPDYYYRTRGDGPVGTRLRDTNSGLDIDGSVGGTPTKAQEKPVVRNCFLQGCS